MEEDLYLDDFPVSDEERERMFWSTVNDWLITEKIDVMGIE